MRKTRRSKRGGVDDVMSDEKAEFDAIDAELSNARDPEEKYAAVEKYIDFVKNSKVMVKSRAFREKVLRFFDDVGESSGLYVPLFPKMREAYRYVKSIPEGELVAGRRRKSRRARKTMRRHRK